MTLHGAEENSRTYVKDGADRACCDRRAFVKGASAAALAALASEERLAGHPHAVAGPYNPCGPGGHL